MFLFSIVAFEAVLSNFLKPELCATYSKRKPFFLFDLMKSDSFLITFVLFCGDSTLQRYNIFAIQIL